MSKRITIEDHLSLEELEIRYRQAFEPVERTHYQIIWLLKKGLGTLEVATVTGYSRSWIYELVWGYNRSGPMTLGDQRSAESRWDQTIAGRMSNKHTFGKHYRSHQLLWGLWNGRKVADWIAGIIGRPVSRQE